MIKLLTMESEHFLVTAYPAQGRLRTMVSMRAKEECAAGNAAMLSEMAAELTAMGACAKAAQGYMRMAEGKQEKGGGEGWRLAACCT